VWCNAIRFESSTGVIGTASITFFQTLQVGVFDSVNQQQCMTLKNMYPVRTSIEGALERLHQRSVSDPALEILDEAHQVKSSESTGKVVGPRKNALLLGAQRSPGAA
jgi:hypothetical protein